MNPQTVKVSILKQQKENRKELFRLRKLFKESPDFSAKDITLAEKLLRWQRS